MLSSRTERSRNQLGKALRDAANAPGRMKSNEDYLVRFFRKIAFKKGRGAAITATARKLAVILHAMIAGRQSYPSELPPDYERQIRLRQLKRIAKDVEKHAITMAELSILLPGVR